MKSCFMFGHSDCPDTMLPKIEAAVELVYKSYGVRVFYVGSRGRFDSLAATATKGLNQKYPDISLHLVLVYHPGEQAVDLSPGFDGSYYPPLEGVPRRYAIVRANHYMVDSVDTIICYVNHRGNASHLLEYARRKNSTPVENTAYTNSR